MAPKKAPAQAKQDNVPFVRPQMFLEFSRRGVPIAAEPAPAPVPDPEDAAVADAPPAEQATTEVTPQVDENGEPILGEVVVGRFVFEIASDLVPKTAENFKQLCTGAIVGDKKGKDPKTACYKGNRLLRVTDEAIQTGDVTGRDDGKGTDCIHGMMFDDENLGSTKHQIGTLSMVNSGPNTNGCQFFICMTDEAAHLDGRHTSFGRLLSPVEELQAFHSLVAQYYADEVLPATDEAAAEKLYGRLPLDCPFFISNCGVVEQAPVAPPA